ncbi:Reverse transcriptase [Phytophthora palmivora]|uniref:Reverse transcriptase n=1 Tax=Phytophthora palmivora TaxID=4796 RepID=A0A2P4YFK7_9STRA|nr:Reverse transcriptase [Phytophthora palmivora]
MFNRLITQLFRPLHTFEQTYFDDIFVNSHAEDDQTVMEVHSNNLRRLFEFIRADKRYANIDKSVFAAEEITVLGCFVSRLGVRADPGRSKILRLGRRRGPKRTSGRYAELARPLSDLLKKDADWVWEQQHQDAFDSIKASLQYASVLALPDENK